MIIGAQLYTVRDFTKNLPDFAETLKKVADIGYTTVQVSGTCDFEAEWLKENLQKNGLSCVLTHTKPAKILEETENVCRDHGIFSCPNIGLGAMPGGRVDDEVYQNFVTNFKPAIEKIHALGYKFFYHNHAFEFTRSTDGKLFMDKILEAFPAEMLGITMDTYWLQFAGADVCDWTEKFAGRLECVHLKDMVPTAKNENRMAPVGYGNMNFEKIIAACEKAGAQNLLVEQDNCYEEDPFACLKKSYDYLRSLGLA